MADNFLNKTGLQYYHERAKTVFADKATVDDLATDVEALAGAEPNVIDTVKVNGTALTPDAQKAVNITVPTAVSDLTNDSDYQTGTEVAEEIDTKIADSIGSSAAGSIASKQYVDQNGGKIDVIEVNGTPQAITNKTVDITVPTKTSDITNDSTYQTLAEVTQAIDDAIAGVTQFDYQIVQTLPATGVKGTIYLVEDEENPGSYIEWIYVENDWEQIGHTGTVDLTNYWSKTELTAITTAEIDTIIGA